MTQPPEVRRPPAVLGRAGRTGAAPAAGASSTEASSSGGGGGPRGPVTAPRPPRRPPLVGVALVMILVLAAGAAYVHWALGPPGASTDPVEFEIERGTGVRTIAADLQAQGLVRDARVFLALVRWRGIDRRIGEGLYDLAPAMDASEVAEALARGGRPRTVRIVIPEGSRISDVATRLEVAGLAEREAALALMREPPEEVGAIVPLGNGLEGYLFPATYDVPVRERGARTLGRMVERFERELDAATRARLTEAGLDVHEWVTLASMVQAEAANDAEMPIIAGVFLNRLDIGMPLQSDPTVAYGLGKDLPALDFPGGDFAVDHPWNTYTRGGLPAGPIGNPGRAALDAVLEPQRVAPGGRAWLYFLHGSADGAIVFRPNVDYDGHLRDVARYLRR